MEWQRYVKEGLAVSIRLGHAIVPVPLHKTSCMNRGRRCGAGSMMAYIYVRGDAVRMAADVEKYIAGSDR